MKGVFFATFLLGKCLLFWKFFMISFQTTLPWDIKFFFCLICNLLWTNFDWREVIVSKECFALKAFFWTYDSELSRVYFLCLPIPIQGFKKCIKHQCYISLPHFSFFLSLNSLPFLVHPCLHFNICVFKRPGVARAVLQTHLSFIH